MTAAIQLGQDVDIRDDVRGAGVPWWLYLVLGITWIFVAMFVLQFDLASVLAIGLMIAFVALFAGISEFVAAFTLPGWKWIHALMGVLFIAAGIWAVAYPGQTFGTLALLIGWFLLVKGTFDVVASLMNRGVDLWWLSLTAGILEIAVAFWAVGYPGRSATLLVLWVGLGALIRGVADILLAFQIRSLQRGARGW